MSLSRANELVLAQRRLGLVRRIESLERGEQSLLLGQAQAIVYRHFGLKMLHRLPEAAIKRHLEGAQFL